MCTISPSFRLFTIESDRTCGSHKYTQSGSHENQAFTIESDSTARHKRRLHSPFAEIPDNRQEQLFCVSRDNEYVFSAGHWDNSIKITTMENKRQIDTIRGHSDLVTCIALSDDGRRLISGSRDTTVMCWDINCEKQTPSSLQNIFTNTESGFRAVKPARHVLYGHSQAITAVAIDQNHDVIVSTSLDGTFVIHTAISGAFVRIVSAFDTLSPSMRILQYEHDILKVCVTQRAQIIIYVEKLGTDQPFSVCIYTINGKPLRRLERAQRVLSMSVDNIGSTLLIVGEDNSVDLYSLDR